MYFYAFLCIFMYFYVFYKLSMYFQLFYYWSEKNWPRCVVKYVKEDKRLEKKMYGHDTFLLPLGILNRLQLYLYKVQNRFSLKPANFFTIAYAHSTL